MKQRTIFFLYLEKSQFPQFVRRIEGIRTLPTQARLQLGGMYFDMDLCSYDPSDDTITYFYKTDKPIPDDLKEALIKLALSTGWESMSM